MSIRRTRIHSYFVTTPSGPVPVTVKKPVILEVAA